MIDYEAQFKTLTLDEFTVMCVNPVWKRAYRYLTARTAFGVAQRMEDAGVGVAFAKYDDVYYVWTE